MSFRYAAVLGLLIGRLGAVQGRTAYAAAPVSVNRTTFLTEIDPSVSIVGDYDAVSIVWDSYGVPWDSFLHQAPLPAWWEDRLNRTVAATLAWGLPIVLTLPGGGGDRRSCPADNASESGSTYPAINPVDAAICPGGCFDYNQITNPIAGFFRQAYVNFALFMVAQFNPINVALAIDANRAAEACSPAAFASYVDFLNQVYATVKNFAPALPAFPSFSHESVLGVLGGQPCEGLAGAGGPVAPPALVACAEAGVALLAGFRRDALALSMLPAPALFSATHDWQLWYATIVLDALPPADAASVVITAYGYPSATIVVNVANDTAQMAGSRADVRGAGTMAPPAVLQVTSPVRRASGAPPPAAQPPLAAIEPNCYALLNATLTDSTDFFHYLVDLSTRYSFGHVAFYGAWDLLPAEAVASCPCDAAEPHAWACTYLGLYRSVCLQAGLPSYVCEAEAKQRGSLGPRDVDGAGGELLAAVQAARGVGAVGGWLRS